MSGALPQNEEVGEMISIVVQKRHGGNKRDIEPFHVCLQLDLQEFLATATKMPAIARLAGLCIYDDTDIDGEWLEALIRELHDLLRTMQEDTITLYVPDEVGATSDEDLRMPFGRDGLLKWATDLLHLCEVAADRLVPLQARGD